MVESIQMASDGNILKHLIIALANAINAEGGSVGKTRLIKFLYLTDLAYYRSKGTTLTGFNWICHLYGPWTPEFDNVLSQMEAEGLINFLPWKHPEGEACLIQPTSQGATLHSIVGDIEAEFEINQHVGRFASGPLG